MVRRSSPQACHQCSAPFDVTPDDLAFYEKVSPVFNGKKELIPPPQLCPDCRWQQLFAWRNDRKLYHRKCDLTGKQIISIYAPEKPYKVYEQHDWWGDTWDAIDQGRAFDFHRPFFEQFGALLRDVPLPSLHTERCENSDYGNFNWGVKNSYLVFASDLSQDCSYSHLIVRCEDCMDCSFCKECRFCYELLDSEKCYRCFYSKELTNCDAVDFSFDCKNCKYCFGCTGLRGKEYYFFNTPLKKEEYEARLAELTLTKTIIEQIRLRAQEAWGKHPRLAAHLLQCEDCTGDNLLGCKNCRDCYDGAQALDCVRVQNTPGETKDCHDMYGVGFGAELNYRGSNVAGQRTLFSFLIYPTGNDVSYSAYCGSCQNIFGCIGLKRKQYCILNRQYSKEEYEKLVPKIIEHMRKTPLRSSSGSSAGQEWGEFFPARLSPFAYNESLAMDHFPLTKEQVLKRGLAWHDEEEQRNYLGPTVPIPDNIRTVDEAICGKILRCESSGKPFKIIPQELKFYRDMGIPIPRKCPDQRHQERIAPRNPRKLWKRNCMKCSKEIETTYAPDRPETIYCEECYLASVY